MATLLLTKMICETHDSVGPLFSPEIKVWA